MAKSKTTKKSAGDLKILVPKKGPPQRRARRVDPSVTTHALPAWTAQEFFDRDVDSKEMGADWKKKLDRIVDVATSAAATKDKAWHIDEIEIGLTLSAKGELLFIAEAGVEATVKVVLKRT